MVEARDMNGINTKEKGLNGRRNETNVIQSSYLSDKELLLDESSICIECDFLSFPASPASWVTSKSLCMIFVNSTLTTLLFPLVWSRLFSLTLSAIEANTPIVLCIKYTLSKKLSKEYFQQFFSKKQFKFSDINYLEKIELPIHQ